MQDHIKGLIHEKAASVDFMFYETPAYHDGLERVRNEAASRSLALIENAGGLVQNGITFLAMATVLMSYSVWLPLVLLISTLPALYALRRAPLRPPVPPVVAPNDD
jgi:ATP-binding cassette subfamily B protein